MSVAEPKYVPTPFSRRFRFWRQRYAPVVVWVLAVVAVVALIQQRSVYVEAPAIAQSRDAAVASVEDGVLQGIHVGLFEHVEAGQVVAVMDDCLFRAEKAEAEVELARLRAEVAAARERLLVEASERERDLIDTRRRFALNEEEARLDVLDRVVEQETNRIELENLAIMVSRQRDLVAEAIGDRAAYDEIRLRHAALEVELRENETAIAAARARLDETARRRKAQIDSAGDVDFDEPLRPLREAVNAQNAAVEALAASGGQLLLKSPIAGQVTQILARAGEAVLAGLPLITVTGDAPEHVLAYVPETTASTIQVGARAEVCSRHNPREIHVARVIQASARIEELPLRLQRSPMFAEWGRPVMIGGIPADAFIPGEVLDVRTSNEAVE